MQGIQLFTAESLFCVYSAFYAPAVLRRGVLTVFFVD